MYANIGVTKGDTRSLDKSSYSNVGAVTIATRIKRPVL